MRRFRIYRPVFLVMLGVTTLLGQASSPAGRVRESNSEVLRLQALMRHVPPSQAAALRGEVGLTVEQRATALRALIRENPSEALKVAFSEDFLAGLRLDFGEAGRSLEFHGQWQGVMETMIADGPDMRWSQTVHRLRTSEGPLEIHFAGAEPARMKSGDTVTVKGVRVDGEVAAESAMSVPFAPSGAGATAEAPSQCSTLSAQSVVAILVNFPNYKLGTATPEMIRGVLFGNANTSSQNTPDWSVDDFWRQNSDGATSAPVANGLVVGPYQLNSDFNTSGACESSAVETAAIAAADAEVDFRRFNRLVIVMPNNVACNWGGLSSLGCWNNTSPGDGSFTSSVSWIRADGAADRSLGVRDFVHELGHGLGLGHASTRDFSPRQPLAAPGVAGVLNEYGDNYSVMGYWNFGLYSAPHSAELLNWLTPSNYQVVRSGGSYAVQSYEARPAGVKALKIQRGSGNSSNWLWLEYRQNQGIYDSQLDSQLFGKALIHYADSTAGSRTHLPDFTSATTSFLDTGLAVGQTYTDPYTDLSLHIDSAVNGTMNVTVNYGTVTCTHANPTLTMSPSNPSTPEQMAANYTVAVTNNDAPGCSSNNFTLSLSQPSDSSWSGIFSPPALTLAPGASGSATLALTPPAGSAGQTYTVEAAAASGSYSGSVTAGITVTAPPEVFPIAASVTVPNATYPAKSTVPITATVTSNGSPVSGATVSFSLKGARNATNTLTTESNGQATWFYRVVNKGTYSVSATATYGSQSAAASADTFTVK